MSSLGGDLVTGDGRDVELWVTEDRAARLAAAFLLGYSGQTRRAYSNDLRHFFLWCAEASVDPLELQRHHVNLYVRMLEETPQPRTGKPAAASTVARRLSAIAGFYDYGIDEAVIDRSPVARVRRPKVDDESPSTGFSRTELQAMIRAAAADGQRSEALVTLLALNGLRIDEALSRDIEDLGYERGHRVLKLERKGGKRAVTALAGPTVRALERYISARDSGPIFITSTGRRMTQPGAWKLVRRLARTAAPDVAGKVNPHSFRHAFVTAALDAGEELRDVQDAAGHADPRTTRRYDRARHNLDRAPTYAVASYLAEAAEEEGTK